MDDVVWNIFNSTWFAEVITYGVSFIILVHDVTFGHQCDYTWLLLVGNRRLGLVQGQMEY